MNNFDLIAGAELANALAYLAAGDRIKALKAAEDAVEMIEDAIVRERQKVTAHAVASIVRGFTAGLKEAAI